MGAATAAVATSSHAAAGGGPALRHHSADDHQALRALWSADASGPALGLSAADSESGYLRLLERNPGLSFALWEGTELVGSVLTGHDGRRGHLYHLVVRADRRRRGFGRLLVEQTLHALASDGIQKVHVMVYAANDEGRRFWEALGFVLRDELVVLSKETGPDDG